MCQKTHNLSLNFPFWLNSFKIFGNYTQILPFPKTIRFARKSPPREATETKPWPRPSLPPIAASAFVFPAGQLASQRRAKRRQLPEKPLLTSSSLQLSRHFSTAGSSKNLSASASGPLPAFLAFTRCTVPAFRSLPPSPSRAREHRYACWVFHLHSHSVTLCAPSTSSKPEGLAG